MSRIPNIPLKLGKEYVDKSELLSKPCPIFEDLSMNKCLQYEREFWTLDHLTKLKSSSTPKHIANFQHDEANPWVRGGFLCFVVMKKITGRKVSDFSVFDPETPEQRNEQHRIQQAFKKALL
jgi:hypothetical protein